MLDHYCGSLSVSHTGKVSKNNNTNKRMSKHGGTSGVVMNSRLNVSNIHLDLIFKVLADKMYYINIII